MDKKDPVIISLGGSLVIPNGGIDEKFLIKLNKFIREKITAGWRFFIVVGGGSTARHYIDSAVKVSGNIDAWDLDWLGIHTTRLNAHLIRTIFRDIAHPRVIANYEKKISNLNEKLVIASGWKPGCSTDYDAAYLAKIYGSKILINMSNISSVFDKDPKKHNDAKPIHRINWTDFSKIVGDKWVPGSNLPFDPVATKLAGKLGLNVYVVGSDLYNIDNILNGKEFKGTLISS